MIGVRHCQPAGVAHETWCEDTVGRVAAVRLLFGGVLRVRKKIKVSPHYKFLLIGPPTRCQGMNKQRKKKKLGAKTSLVADSLHWESAASGVLAPTGGHPTGRSSVRDSVANTAFFFFFFFLGLFITRMRPIQYQKVGFFCYWSTRDIHEGWQQSGI